MLALAGQNDTGHMYELSRKFGTFTQAGFRLAALRATTLAELKQKTFLTPFAESPQPANTSLLAGISHLAAQRGQIRIRHTLYRKARGEQGWFLLQNPTFGE